MTYEPCRSRHRRRLRQSARSWRSASSAKAIASSRFDRDRDGLDRRWPARSAQASAPVTVTGDVGEADDVEACMPEAEACFGPVEVLINNAGTAGGPSATTTSIETSVEDFDRVVAVNIRGPFPLAAVARFPPWSSAAAA